MEKAKTIGQFAVAFGLVYLASAILYLTIEVSTISKQIPLTLAGLEEVDTAVLSLIDRTLDTIPLVTNEIAGVRQLIPEVLSGVEAMRQAIPLILAESKAIREVMPDVFTQMEETRNAIAPVVVEIAALREEMPIIIQDAKDLVEQARTASQEMGEKWARGAVQGTVEGVISAPFKVLIPGGNKVTPEDEDE